MKKGEPEEIYGALSVQRREQVKPLVVDSKDYVRGWLDYEYEKKDFLPGTPGIYTEKGERVRSKSEKILADKFLREGLPYRYECPLFLKGIGWVHPDFMLLDVANRREIYWEHCGLMDEPEYCNYVLKKVDAYIQNGFIPRRQLILSYETKSMPLNIRSVEKIIEFYFH